LFSHVLNNFMFEIRKGEIRKFTLFAEDISLITHLFTQMAYCKRLNFRGLKYSRIEPKLKI
ncbi:MAG: hypothetical protein PV344_04230, partial [Anaplasma sp.]|nr:hypothetical protein [Anaplasma sp.]